MKKLDFKPYVRLAMYHTWLFDFVADRSIFDNEIIYIDKGELSLYIDGKTHICREGDVCIIPPNTYHKITWHKENCCQPHIHFDFNKDDLSEQIPVSMKRFEEMNDIEKTYFRTDFLKENDIKLPYVYSSKNPDTVRNLILKMIDEFSSNDPYKDLALEGLLKQLIAFIISENIGYYFDSEKRDTLSQISKLMADNLQNNISINDLLLTVNLSAWAINDLFNKNYGMPPKKYYDMLRLRYVKNLLRHSFKNVKEIATLMNFNNPQTFSRWFKEQTGIYPSQYKENKKKVKE